MDAPACIKRPRGCVHSEREPEDLTAEVIVPKEREDSSEEAVIVAAATPSLEGIKNEISPFPEAAQREGNDSAAVSIGSQESVSRGSVSPRSGLLYVVRGGGGGPLLGAESARGRVTASPPLLGSKACVGPSGVAGAGLRLPRSVRIEHRHLEAAEELEARRHRELARAQEAAALWEVEPSTRYDPEALARARAELLAEMTPEELAAVAVAAERAKRRAGTRLNE